MMYVTEVADDEEDELEEDAAKFGKAMIGKAQKATDALSTNCCRVGEYVRGNFKLQST